MEWGGILIKSKVVRDTLINETFHFNIPMTSDTKDDENKLTDFLSNDLKTKSSVRFNIWVDYGDHNYDNVGTAYAGLYNLYTAEADEKTFKDSNQRKKIRFMTRTYNGKANLKSAFHDITNCYIHFGMWFQPEIPNPGVDLSKLYDPKEDFVPYELRDKLESDDGFFVSWHLKIEENFESDELKNDREFMNPYFQDQYQK